MASPLSSSLPRVQAASHTSKLGKLGFNVDAVAIVTALLLAALVRLNVLPHIGW